MKISNPEKKYYSIELKTMPAAEASKINTSLYEKVLSYLLTWGKNRQYSWKRCLIQTRQNTNLCGKGLRYLKYQDLNLVTAMRFLKINR